MMHRHACFGSQGTVALGGLIAAAICLLGLPSSGAASLLATVPDDTSALQQVLPLLEQVRQDQGRLRESLDLLAARQEAGFDRHARALREGHLVLATRLATQQDQEMESLLDLRRWVLVMALGLAGVVLFSMAAVGWSVLRMLQRLPVRPLAERETATVAPVSLIAETQLLLAIEHLEKRILELGTQALKPGTGSPGRALLSGNDESGALPGDFL